jgi:hypothetical protein
MFRMMLAHIVGHLLCHDPRGDIDRAGGRQRHDHLDRPVGVIRLRECSRSADQRRKHQG